MTRSVIDAKRRHAEPSAFSDKPISVPRIWRRPWPSGVGERRQVRSRLWQHPRRQVAPPAPVHAARHIAQGSAPRRESATKDITCRLNRRLKRALDNRRSRFANGEQCCSRNDRSTPFCRRRARASRCSAHEGTGLCNERFRPRTDRARETHAASRRDTRRRSLAGGCCEQRACRDMSRDRRVDPTSLQDPSNERRAATSAPSGCRRTDATCRRRTAANRARRALTISCWPRDA